MEALGSLCFLGGVEIFTPHLQLLLETPTNLVGGEHPLGQRAGGYDGPQRATLFGWAMLFPTLYLLYRAAFEGQRRIPANRAHGGAPCPWCHTHPFWPLGLICGVAGVFPCAASSSGRKLPPGVEKPCLSRFAWRWRWQGVFPWAEDSPLFTGWAGVVLAFPAVTAFLAVKTARLPGGGNPPRPGACSWRLPCCRRCPSFSTGSSIKPGQEALSGTYQGWDRGKMPCCST